MSYLVNDRSFVSMYAGIELPDGTLLLLLESPPAKQQLQGDPGPQPRTIRGRIGRSGWVISAAEEGGVDVTMILQVGLGAGAARGRACRLGLGGGAADAADSAALEKAAGDVHGARPSGQLACKLQPRPAPPCAAPQIDPAGSVPTSVVNACNMTIPMHLERIRRLLARMDEQEQQRCRDWYRGARLPSS